MLLKVGDKAPMFALPDADMETVDLAAYKGKKHVVLDAKQAMRAQGDRPIDIQLGVNLLGDPSMRLH